MIWRLFPQVLGGGGGGGSGISDVTGDDPIIVTSPSATTRNVALNPAIPGTFTSFPAGVMASIGRRRIGWAFGDTVGNLIEHGQVGTSTGSLTAPGVANTDFFASAARLYRQSTGAINARAGYAFANNQVFRGNVALTGGFIFENIFGFVAGTSTSRFFSGLGQSGGCTLASDPSAEVDAVFIGFDSADSNFQVMHNDNAGSCTKVDLGANFPKPTGAALARDVYYMMLYCAPNVGGTAQNVKYYLLRLDDPTKVTSGELTTNLPTASVALFQSVHYGTGPSSAVAVQMAWMRMQTETTL